MTAVRHKNGNPPSVADLTSSNPKARLWWSSADSQLLGQASDEDVALQLGRSDKAVMQRRLKLRIAKFNARLRRWTKEEDDWLHTMRNQEFSRRFNRTVAAIQQRRYDLGIPQPKRVRPWTDKEDALLGKMSCHRADQNRPAMSDSKPATLR
jgi:hypothetical protein